MTATETEKGAPTRTRQRLLSTGDREEDLKILRQAGREYEPLCRHLEASFNKKSSVRGEK